MGNAGKRGWRKLHLGVNGSGAIVAQVLTDGNADDAAKVPDLLGQLEGELSGFVADTAYDSRQVYDAATARGAVVVIPPKERRNRWRSKRDAMFRSRPNGCTSQESRTTTVEEGVRLPPPRHR